MTFDLPFNLHLWVKIALDTDNLFSGVEHKNLMGEGRRLLSYSTHVHQSGGGGGVDLPFGGYDKGNRSE